jgi:hypothetical protein
MIHSAAGEPVIATGGTPIGLGASVAGTGT